MTHVRVNGVDLEYEEAGAGVPVVFSHGGSSDLRYWEPQREVFAERYRFVAFSRRFHGSGASRAKGDGSAGAHVEDLVEIVRRLEAGPVHLVGFSTSLALRAALREPSLLRSLTIIEPNVPWLLEGDPAGEDVLAWWRHENERVNRDAADDEERAARLWFELVDNRGPGTFDAQPADFRRMWLDNFRTTRRAGAPADPLTCAKLSAIATPTLAIGAEFGMPYSRRIVDALTACIPGCRRVVVPGATHFMSYQEPAVFNEVVLDFLERQEG